MIAAGSGVALDVINSWKFTPGYYKILDTGYTDFGCGYTEGGRYAYVFSRAEHVRFIPFYQLTFFSSLFCIFIFFFVFLFSFRFFYPFFFLTLTLFLFVCLFGWVVHEFFVLI